VARLRVAVLISGRGSNLQALIDACSDPGFPAEIRLVISNEPGAQGLIRAERARIPARVIAHKQYAERASFDAALDRALEEAGIELVCLAGFMRMLGDPFVARWRNRLINIHPSLLPAFKGLKTHERVLAEEHKAYPLALRLIAEGRVRVIDERVEIRGAAGPAPAALSNPTG